MVRRKKEKETERDGEQKEKREDGEENQKNIIFFFLKVKVIDWLIENKRKKRKSEGLDLK